MLRRYWVGVCLGLASALLYADEGGLQHGQLDNGVQYWIKAHTMPPGQVSLRLLVRAGSLDEQPHELGAAHLLEHMAFRGTRRFDDAALQAFFNQGGQRLFGDSNAFTGFAQTNYQLDVNREQTARAIELLADWASGGIEIDPVELATERAVVFDEMRMRAPDQRRWRDYLGYVSPARAARMPIGEQDVLAALTPAQLRDFYLRNYRGARVEVVVVGDIDPKAVEAQLRREFAAVPAGSVPERPQEAPQALALDLEYGNSNPNPQLVGWGWQLPPLDEWEHFYRQKILFDVLYQRMQQRSDDRRYSEAGYGFDAIEPGLSRWMFYALPRSQQGRQALEAVREEVERLRQHGVSYEELSRSKQRLRQQDEGWASQVYDSAWWANRALEARQQRWPNLSPEQWMKLLPELEARADLAAVNAELARLEALPQVLLVSCNQQNPQDEASCPRFDVEQGRALRADVAQRDLPALQADTAYVGGLGRAAPVGRIVADRVLPDGGELELENGLKVRWLKALHPDEQLGFSLSSDGGANALPAEQRAQAALLPAYLHQGGLAGLRREQVNDALAGRSLGLEVWVGEDAHGISGQAGKQDVPTLMQLVQLLWLAPQGNQRSIEFARRAQRGVQDSPNYQRLEQLAYREQWPKPWFDDAQLDRVNGMQLDALQARLFADPASFRVVLTGVHDPDSLRLELAAWLAGIPKRGDALPRGARLALKGEGEVFNLPSRNVDNAQLFWGSFSEQDVGAREVWQLQALSDVLQQRLLQVLRHDGGFSYAVAAGGDFGRQRGPVLLMMHQGERTQCVEMALKVRDALQALRRDGMNAAEHAQALERLNKLWRERWQAPQSFAGGISFATRAGAELPGAPDAEPLKSALTREALNAQLRRWINPQQLYLETHGCARVPEREQLLQGW